MTATSTHDVKLPPRPAIRTFWALHRFAHRATGGRFGLKTPVAGGRFGMLRLATIGRRSGRARVAIVGYVEDGANLVTIAMNGWGQGDPAWWLNLQANPDAEVGLPDGNRAVRARAAVGEERDRLWAMIADYPGWGDDLDGLAAHRPGETAVVVLEPRSAGHGEPVAGPVGPAVEPGHGAVEPASDRSAAVATRRRFRLRLRYGWVLPGLAVAIWAGLQSDAHGFGPLLPLAFGLGPHAGVVLGLTGVVAGRRVAAAGILLHNLLHHPLPPLAMVLAGATGIASPMLLVGGLAWLGHIVIGWAVGDGHKAGDHRQRRPAGRRLRLGRGSSSATAPAGGPA